MEGRLNPGNSPWRKGLWKQELDNILVYRVVLGDGHEAITVRSPRVADAIG